MSEEKYEDYWLCNDCLELYDDEEDAQGCCSGDVSLVQYVVDEDEDHD